MPHREFQVVTMATRWMAADSSRSAMNSSHRAMTAPHECRVAISSRARWPPDPCTAGPSGSSTMRAARRPGCPRPAPPRPSARGSRWVLGRFERVRDGRRRLRRHEVGQPGVGHADDRYPAPWPRLPAGRTPRPGPDGRSSRPVVERLDLTLIEVPVDPPHVGRVRDGWSEGVPGTPPPGYGGWGTS